MTKIFISQPMADKTNEEIIEERRRIEKYAINTEKRLGNDDVLFLDSFFDDYNDISNDNECFSGINKPVWYLARSVNMLSSADVVYFAPEWYEYRGCRIEQDICLWYDIRHEYCPDFGMEIEDD